ncbi:MAG: lipoprotein signal peptidase [Bacteroidia bacterium]|nr:lipoprotein signal peptidase [Bacteroidia bacterium]
MKKKLTFPGYLGIAFLVVVLDQIVKLIVKFNMQLGQEYKVIGNLFKIHFIENPGAAFGLTISNLYEIFTASPLPEETGKLILSIFSILAVGFIAYYLKTISNQQTKLPLFMALILGGAVGNIIDRVFYGVWFASMNDYEGGFLYGRVVDMFYLDIWKGHLPDWIPIIGGEYYSFWPIFNIADAAISIGIVAILWFQKDFFQHSETELPSSNAQSSQETTNTQSSTDFSAV